MPWFRSLAVLVVCASVGRAADWPQWLGPDRDGATAEKVVPWKGPLKVLWRQPLGEGHSSPVVAGGRVYVHARVPGADSEVLHAFDAKDGKPLWSTPYPRGPYQGKFGLGPRSTPTVADGKVYTLGITGILTCFDADRGKQLWQVNLLKRFQARNLVFGVSCSPLVEGKLVLVNVGGKGASVVALNRESGETVWQKLDDGASYSSPIVFGKGKARQVVFFTQEGLVSLRPTDGTVFWKYPLKDQLSESSSTPVRVGDLVVGSAITAGSAAVRVIPPAPGREAKATEVWKNPDLTCYFSTPVAVGKDHLYLVTGSLLAGQATLRCVETATGKELWKKGGVGKYHASLLRTGDNKLLMLEEAGHLVLLDPSPNEYRELARAKVCGNTWAHPAVADGRLYVRDGKELICVQLP